MAAFPAQPTLFDNTKAFFHRLSRLVHDTFDGALQIACDLILLFVADISDTSGLDEVGVGVDMAGHVEQSNGWKW